MRRAKEVLGIDEGPVGSLMSHRVIGTAVADSLEQPHKGKRFFPMKKTQGTVSFVVGNGEEGNPRIAESQAEYSGNLDAETETISARFTARRKKFKLKT